VLRPPIQAHLLGDQGKDVIARRIAEVPSPDFGPHVPPVEGGSRIVDAADLEAHAAESRDGMPLEPKVRKPVEDRVDQRDFDNSIARQLEETRCAPVSRSIAVCQRNLAGKRCKK
jgi:hypothetical protein